MYDANIKANSAGPSTISAVHVEDWEVEGYETTETPLEEASMEVEDEVP